MVKIAIGAGHGIKTPGKAVPAYMGKGKISEWELNDKVTRRQIELLKEYENVEIIRLDDPTGQTDVPLKTRTDKANQFRADLLVSNHHNAGINGGEGGGLVLYRYPGSTKFTKAMQEALYNSLIKNGAIKGNRANPLTSDNLHMLRESNMAAILPEYAFMDSKVDIEEILKPDFADRMAKGVVDWIVQHFNLIKKDKVVESPSPSIPPSPPSKPVGDSKGNMTTNSIVTYLNSVKVDSSFNNRSKLAKQNGIKNYTGTAEQNLKLLSILRKDKPATTKPSTPKKPITDIAKEVIAGKWGNGTDRKSRLEKAGYNFTTVQSEVNRLMGGSPVKKKSTNEIAREVINGKWGNGVARKNKLEQAGYNYKTIQAEVNKLLK